MFLQDLVQDKILFKTIQSHCPSFITFSTFVHRHCKLTVYVVHSDELIGQSLAASHSSLAV